MVFRLSVGVAGSFSFPVAQVGRTRRWALECLAANRAIAMTICWTSVDFIGYWSTEQSGQALPSRYFALSP